VLPIIGLAIKGLAAAGLTTTTVAEAVLEVLTGFQPQQVAAVGSLASVITSILITVIVC
jgi:hypothetical protein